jgi:hypothetical protein
MRADHLARQFGRAGPPASLRPFRADMSFRRPYWLLLYSSLGCLALGFAVWMLVTPDFKGPPDLRLWFLAGGELLGLIGAIGFLGSLLWMIVAGISSGVRSPRPRH